MGKKIFVAVPVPPELQEGIKEWEKDFLDLPVRWLSGKNLHITLVPPWNEEDIDSVRGKLKALSDYGKFEIDFKRVNFGPNPREPRLIWAENKPTKRMIELRDKTETLLGRRSDYRNWTMHVTLARFRPETFSSFPVKKLDEVIWWPMKVDSVVLMESLGFSEYDILETINL